MPLTMDPVIPALEAAARSKAVSRYIAPVLERVERELAVATAPMAWEPVPLDDGPTERHRYQTEPRSGRGD